MVMQPTLYHTCACNNKICVEVVCRQVLSATKTASKTYACKLCGAQNLHTLTRDTNNHTIGNQNGREAAMKASPCNDYQQPRREPLSLEASNACKDGSARLPCGRDLKVVVVKGACRVPFSWTHTSTSHNCSKALRILYAATGDQR